MAVTKTKVKKSSGNELGINPRDLTVQQRRMLFAKRAKTYKDDWRVVHANQTRELIPFNHIVLDHVLKLYGLARGGSVYQLHGPEGGGKSTTAYTMLKNYQDVTSEGVAILDFEGTTTSSYLRKIGLDESTAFVIKPESIQEALKACMGWLNDGVRIFMWDSIPRMKALVEVGDVMSGEAFKTTVGKHARDMELFYSIMLPHIIRADGTLIMINQIRSRLDMTREAQQAVKWETVTNLNYSLPGGRANKYAIGVMIELQIRKAYRPGKAEDPFLLEEVAKNGEEYLAVEHRVRTLKNKITGTGYREGTIWIRPGLGIDENISIRQIARDLGFITNHGKRYYVGETFETAIKVYGSKEEAVEDLTTNPNLEVLAALKDLLVEKLTNDPSLIPSLVVSEEVERDLSGEGLDDIRPSLKATFEDDELV